MLDPNEFLSNHGVRSLSKYHGENPYCLQINGKSFFCILRAWKNSASSMFGGNSNWRGPVWMPLNFLIIESLQRFYHYYGNDFKVECPTGSGEYLNLNEIACFLKNKLIALFEKTAKATELFMAIVKKCNRMLFLITIFYFMNIFMVRMDMVSALRIKPDGRV